MTNVCIVAGEASGDAQGALLVKALKASLSSMHFWGAAGPLLRAQGVEAFLDTQELAVMGVSQILPKYLSISKHYKSLRRAIEQRRPAAVIFIDYPGFNMSLLRDVHALGVTTIYHIPPKAWAHGKRRASVLARYSDLVTGILPFEAPFFQSHGVPYHFIGNPLKDQIDALGPLPLAHFEPESIRIALLPGSRPQEIKALLPLLLESFVTLNQQEPRAVALLPVAQTLSPQFIDNIIANVQQKLGFSDTWRQKHILISTGNAQTVLQNSQYAWICSGTASLEAAFLKTPMSVIYRADAVMAFLAKYFLAIPYISLVNLCAQDLVVPEFLQQAANVSNLVTHALSILHDNDARQHMLQGLDKVCDLFPRDAAANAANLIESYILHSNSLSPEAIFWERYQRRHKGV